MSTISSSDQRNGINHGDAIRRLDAARQDLFQDKRKSAIEQAFQENTVRAAAEKPKLETSSLVQPLIPKSKYDGYDVADEVPDEYYKAFEVVTNPQDNLSEIDKPLCLNIVLQTAMEMRERLRYKYFNNRDTTELCAAVIELWESGTDGSKDGNTFAGDENFEVKDENRSKQSFLTPAIELEALKQGLGEVIYCTFDDKQRPTTSLHWESLRARASAMLSIYKINERHITRCNEVRTKIQDDDAPLTSAHLSTVKRLMGPLLTMYK